MGFLDYDAEIRKIICSTTRSSHSTPTTEQAALKCLYLHPARWTDRTRPGMT
jgi:hypothetical protein